MRFPALELRRFDWQAVLLYQGTPRRIQFERNPNTDAMEVRYMTNLSYLFCGTSHVASREPDLSRIVLIQYWLSIINALCARTYRVAYVKSVLRGELEPELEEQHIAEPENHTLAAAVNAMEAIKV